MSVNGFEITSLMLCARPDVLLQDNALPDRHETVIVDISESWAMETACEQAQSVLDRRRSINAPGSTLLRVGLPGGDGQDAIGRLVALRPDGFVLSCCGGTADIQRFDVMLRVAEAECGLDAGSVIILAEAGEAPGFFLSNNALRDVSARLKGLIFDGAALTNATASQAINMPANRSGAPLLLARATTILKAAQAGLPCLDLLTEEPLSSSEVRIMRDVSLADGFFGVIARSFGQLTALTTV